MNPDFHKVLVYARIIDINDEMIATATKMLKYTKRWNRRPVKTVQGSWRRVGKIMAWAFHARNLANEKRSLLRSLNPPFAVGGPVTGKGKQIEVVLDTKQLAEMPPIDRIITKRSI